MRITSFGLGCVLAIGLSSSLHAGNINVTAGSMFIRAWDRSGGAQESILAASLPLDTSDSVTDGFPAATNLTTYDFSNSGFTITVDHTRAGFGGHTQSRHQLPVQFTVDQDTPYALSGFYNLAGLERLTFKGVLTDVTTAQALFRNQQESYSTANENFTLGETNGDTPYGELSQFLSGDLTGTLTGGHTYELEYNFLVSHWVGSGQTADANGQIVLQIGAAIPEPSTLAALGGLIGMGLVGGWWRRRRKD